MNNSAPLLSSLPQHLHFIGIGGTGMSALAELLLEAGHTVSGSDLVLTETTAHLKTLGATIYEGHASQQLRSAEQVIFSSAIPIDNPEYCAARDCGLPLWHRSELLAALVNQHEGIVVLGSHGKTTTAWLIAAILHQAGLAPKRAIGGRLSAPFTQAIEQQGTPLAPPYYFVTEGDESDGSFERLQPKIVIVTNIDNDHLGYYQGELAQLRHRVLTFLQQLPAERVVILCNDDPLLREMRPHIHARVITYGVTPQADISVNQLHSQGMSNPFEVRLNQSAFSLVLNKLPGRHNSLNALAAVSVGLLLGIDHQVISTAFQQFPGIDRRLQRLSTPTWLPDKIVLLEDYGHHPNELLATMEAVRLNWPHRRLMMVFQPHRFTRMRDLFDDFVSVLSSVEKLYLLPLYAAGEEAISSASAFDLYRALRPHMGMRVTWVEQPNVLREQLSQTVESTDLLLIQGAGDIHQWIALLQQ